MARFGPQEITNLTNREFILANTTVDEQIDFISDQIKSPFDSGDSNYFKKLQDSVSNDRLDTICIDLLAEIEDRYPGVEFDLSEYDSHLGHFFSSVYKFFVKNPHKLMYTFLREYIFSTKNRNLLVADYMNAKLSNYPKDQYGEKGNYVLVTKLPSIISDIREDNISLKTFIDYIERAGTLSMYIKDVREYLDRGMIYDHNIVDDFFDFFRNSDQYEATICKLQAAITNHIIIPYLKKNDLIDLKFPAVEDIEEDVSDDDDENSDETEM